MIGFRTYLKTLIPLGLLLTWSPSAHGGPQYQLIDRSINQVKTGPDGSIWMSHLNLHMNFENNRPFVVMDLEKYDPLGRHLSDFNGGKALRARVIDDFSDTEKYGLSLLVACPDSLDRLSYRKFAALFLSPQGALKKEVLLPPAPGVEYAGGRLSPHEKGIAVALIGWNRHSSDLRAIPGVGQPALISVFLLSENFDLKRHYHLKLPRNLNVATVSSIFVKSEREILIAGDVVESIDPFYPRSKIFVSTLTPDAEPHFDFRTVDTDIESAEDPMGRHAPAIFNDGASIAFSNALLESDAPEERSMGVLDFRSLKLDNQFGMGGIVGVYASRLSFLFDPRKGGIDTWLVGDKRSIVRIHFDSGSGDKIAESFVVGPPPKTFSWLQTPTIQAIPGLGNCGDRLAGEA